MNGSWELGTCVCGCAVWVDWAKRRKRGAASAASLNLYSKKWYIILTH